jgi:hypothetical protein
MGNELVLAQYSLRSCPVCDQFFRKSSFELNIVLSFSLEISSCNPICLSHYLLLRILQGPRSSFVQHILHSPNQHRSTAY